MKRTKKGFTLAELLIVVAIVGVLVAVAIPVFTSSLDKAKLATDEANLRSAQALYKTALLTGEITANGQTITIAEAAKGASNSPLGTQFYFMKDGSLQTSTTAKPADAYQLQASEDSCNMMSSDYSNTHKQSNFIVIAFYAIDTGSGLSSVQSFLSGVNYAPLGK